MITGMVIDNE